MKSQTTILEMYNINEKKLTDKIFLLNILVETISIIHMKPLGHPYLVYDGKCKKLNKGISGFHFIKESHMAFHSFPYRNYLKFVVSSCKKFNIDDLKNHLSNQLKTKKIEIKTIYSGIHI